MLKRLALATALVLLSGTVLAKWAIRDRDVPVSRLIKNVDDVLAKQPDNAEAHYLLGRLLSYRFALVKSLSVNSGKSGLPSLPPYIWNERPSKKGNVSPSQLADLRQSLFSYRAAVDLNPHNALYELGLTWMFEEAAPYGPQFGKFPWTKEKVTRKLLLDLAMQGYRKLYREHITEDLKRASVFEGADHTIGWEAGEGIVRIQKSDPEGITASELAAVKKNIAKMKAKPITVTPIIFPIRRSGQFYGLVNPNAKINFDLTGDGLIRPWPWVTNKAAFLVWDPRKTGQISSGRQMFGSATFWMFFENGYAALASLDNNHDGWLTGHELDGISVWHDQNQNGISEPGEVKPAKSLGIVAIRVRPSGDISKMPFARVGIKWKDGRTTSTFDWTPISSGDPVP